ncbi:MAG TPA: ABC transporter ATP-binding protein [Treponemataceae bacterium]|nr:ABC transporter ATP-binding protein [Treponemataceae bacterium]
MLKLIKDNLKGSALAWATVAPLMMFLEVAMDLQQPALMARIIDVGVAKGDLPFVLHTGALMIAMAIAGFAGGALCSIFSARAAVTMSGEMRHSLFRKIQSLTFAEIDAFKTSSLVTRVTNDVMQMQHMLLMMLRIMVRSPLIFIGCVIMSFMLSPSLALVFAVIIPLVVASVAIVFSKATPLFSVAQASLDRMNTIMRENLLGARVVKAFTMESHEEARFAGANEELTERSIKAQRLVFVLLPVVTLIMNLGVVFVLWTGGREVMRGGIEIGKIMAFINYLVQISGSLMMAIMLVVNISRAQASAVRINEVLAATPSITEPQGSRHMADLSVEFSRVSFAYPGSRANALTDVSFSVCQGQTVGIIGATGSGKTTLAALIPRLYDVTEGQLLVGGVDVRSLSLAELRERIGMVMQETSLFAGTVEANLRFGSPNASIKDLDGACADAQAIDFLKGPDADYGIPVEQRGRNFSGGQKQRFSIARTLLHEPGILILDDSTSAIDLKTESFLRAAIAGRMRGKTVFVIAQRISAVMNADVIVVLDAGRVAALGAHRELIETSDIYRSIVASQLGEEALRHGN